MSIKPETKKELDDKLNETILSFAAITQYGLFVILWGSIQFCVATVINNFEFDEINRYMIIAFRIVFALLSLIPVIKKVINEFK